MTINVFKHNIKTRAVSEDHTLTIGKYNEFYLPSVGLEHELWVVILDSDGAETTLHLKR